MTIFSIFILSIIEGIAEFLPVSSTAHMYIGSKILGLETTDSLSTFIIAIQVGAIIAGAIFILQKIKITKQVILQTITAFIPTAIIGFTVYPVIKHYLLGNMFVIGLALLIGGMVILLVDKKKEEYASPLSDFSGPRGSSPDTEKSLNGFASDELSYKNAFILGIVQTLAFIPGVSRSGALIIGGRLMNYSRSSIVTFTFLLGLPTLAAATLYDLYKSRDILTTSLGIEIFIGAIISGIVAYIVAKWFLKYITNHTFKIFGWYRIVIGVIILLFFV